MKKLVCEVKRGRRRDGVTRPTQGEIFLFRLIIFIYSSPEERNKTTPAPTGAGDEFKIKMLPNRWDLPRAISPLFAAAAWLVTEMPVLSPSITLEGI